MSVASFSSPVLAGAGQFWLRLLKAVASSIAFAVLIGVVTGIGLFASGADPATHQVVLIAGGVLVAFQTIYSQASVAIERCRAVGRSGWWCLLLLVPLVGPLWLLLDLSFRPATRRG